MDQRNLFTIDGFLVGDDDALRTLLEDVCTFEFAAYVERKFPIYVTMNGNYLVQLPHFGIYVTDIEGTRRMQKWPVVPLSLISMSHPKLWATGTATPYARYMVSTATAFPVSVNAHLTGESVLIGRVPVEITGVSALA